LKVEIYSMPMEVNPNDFVSSTAVVIDVLRASTSIAIALQNGCREIVPTDDVDNAFDIAAALPAQNVLLCGERNGFKVDGFDLGNSPLEYDSATVSNRTLVFTSSNGTRAIKLAEMAGEVVICALINLVAVARYLANSTSDVKILCAGGEGKPCLEDAVCAGLLANRIQEWASEKAQLTNNAEQIISMAQAYKSDLLSMLNQSEHGKYLIKIGRKADLEICARLNSTNVVPVYRDGVIYALDQIDWLSN